MVIDRRRELGLLCFLGAASAPDTKNDSGRSRCAWAVGKLHTRFDCGDDVLAPYKKKLKRFLNPEDVRSDQDVSVSKARRLLSDYKRATGKPEQFLELKMFRSEEALGLLPTKQTIPSPQALRPERR